MPARSAGPDHPPGQTVMSATSLRWRMQANRPRSSGFRRCQAPYCRVSRTKTVWPREYRIAVPVWGRVHLACRPTPMQLGMLRMAAVLRQTIGRFQGNTESIHRRIAHIQQILDSVGNPFGLPPIPRPDLPEHELYEQDWEADAHHWTPEHQDH